MKKITPLTWGANRESLIKFFNIHEKQLQDMTLQYMVQRKEIKNIKLIQNNSQDPSLISMLIIAKQTLTNRIPISN